MLFLTLVVYDLLIFKAFHCKSGYAEKVGRWETLLTPISGSFFIVVPLVDFQIEIRLFNYKFSFSSYLFNIF